MTALQTIPVPASDESALAPSAPSESSQQAHVIDPKLASAAFLSLIPQEFAQRHLLLSQGMLDGVEMIAAADVSDPAAIFNVGTRLLTPVRSFVADAEALRRAVDQAYEGHARSEGPPPPPPPGLAGPADSIETLLQHADRDLLSTQGKGPVIKLVDALLFDALVRGASDVHIQPVADRALVRYRLDGVLHDIRALPASIGPSVISRIKVMGRMDIAERRIPQDGRASVTISDRSIDLRLSTLPTSHGERAVIRLLDNSRHLCEFDKLGMPSEVAGRFIRCASRSSGIILVTGPTGSGKTTTLYSTLHRVGTPRINIMTIEDPIEYELSGLGLAISQSQVNTRKGVSFATGLRHILRQDPDVIMVGEIRDAETARIAIQSSLTGHLVLSSLHTNDAPGAVTRLIDLGIEPYLVSASLAAVLAQRLIRLTHEPCCGCGCPGCLETGFQGRTGLFELMVVTESLAQLIARNTELTDLRRASRAEGLRTLREEGLRLLRADRTSRAELERVVESGD